MILVDAGQLLYHVVAGAGTTQDLVISFGTRLARYPENSEKVVLFDRYDLDAPSTKDHERTRRGTSKELRLTPQNLLSCPEAVLHNAKNKNQLNNLICSYPLPNNVQLVNATECDVTHAEADVTICSYMLKAVANGANTIQILSDDTDLFVILVYWAARMTVRARIQMETWNGVVLDINQTVDQLGPRNCRQLLSRAVTQYHIHLVK